MKKKEREKIFVGVLSCLVDGVSERKERRRKVGTEIEAKIG